MRDWPLYDCANDKLVRVVERLCWRKISVSRKGGKRKASVVAESCVKQTALRPVSGEKRDVGAVVFQSLRSLVLVVVFSVAIGTLGGLRGKVRLHGFSLRPA